MNKNIDYYMELPYRMEIIPDNEEGGLPQNSPIFPAVWPVPTQ